jgi:hypothetical protein
MTNDLLGQVLGRVAEFEVEARTILATHEATPERVVTLEQSYEKLGKLSLDQDELFREALRAVEFELFRAAHVLAWAGFIDFLHHHMWDHFQSELVVERPAWGLKVAEDFREHADFQVIEAGKVVEAYSKTLMRALHGLLNTRNECAHPSDYFPDLNDTLGYLSGIFKRIQHLQSKVPAP